MSEVSCKLPPLMETNQMTESETENPNPSTSTVARYAELQALVAGMAAGPSGPTVNSVARTVIPLESG